MIRAFRRAAEEAGELAAIASFAAHGHAVYPEAAWGEINERLKVQNPFLYAELPIRMPAEFRTSYYAKCAELSAAKAAVA